MAEELAPGVVTLGASDDVDTLLRRALAEIERRGLDLFAVVDHSGKATEAGLSMPDTKVVIFGNPKGGTPLMVAHPLAALDLPLKLLLWESADDATFVSYNAADFLAERYGLSEAEAGPIGVVEAIAQVVVAG